MRYFFDTELIEDGKTIDLISIGIVAEDGREFYALSKECDFSKASDWVLENVLRPIGLDRSGFSRNPGNQSESANYRNSYRQARTRKQLAGELAGFCGCMTVTSIKTVRRKWFPFVRQSQAVDRFEVDKNMPTPEFWAYYADYDWVVLCQLFGTMMDLPKGFPMYCRDLKQEADRLGVDLSEVVPQENEHHALADARWNKKAWEYLMEHE
jgi:hypothetical protein